MRRLPAIQTHLRGCIILSALLGFLWLSSSDLAAWGRGHKLIRAWAIDRLPDWQQSLLQPDDWLRLRTDYTSLQDVHAGGKAPHLDAYCRPPMPVSLHDVGSTKASLIDMQWYLTQILENLHDQQTDEAMKFLGVLCHWNEDPGSLSAHSSPIDELTLRRLLPPSKKLMNKNYLFGYGGIADIGDYTLPEEDYAPVLLGTSIPEAAGRIYQQQRRLRSRAAGKIIPLVQAELAEDPAEANRIRQQAALDNARHVADLLYTVFCLSESRFEADQVQALEIQRLTDIEPELKMQMVPHPYYVTPFLTDCAIDEHRKLHPLAFCGSDQEEPVAFGYGMGTPFTLKFEIGPGIALDRFSARVGLHPTAGENGRVAFAVLVNGQEVVRTPFLGAGEAPRSIDVLLPETAVVSLQLQTIPHPDSTPGHNLTVWGEPTLHRTDAARRPTPAQ